jgi:hypothetical protein
MVLYLQEIWGNIIIVIIAGNNNTIVIEGSQILARTGCLRHLRILEQGGTHEL